MLRLSVLSRIKTLLRLLRLGILLRCGMAFSQCDTGQRGLPLLRLRRENIRDPAQRYLGFTELRDHASQRPDRRHQHIRIGDKGDIASRCEGPADAVTGAEQHDCHHHEAARQIAESPEPRKDPAELHPTVRIDIILRPKAPLLRRLLPECPHHTDAGQILLGDRGEHTFIFIALQKLLADAEQKHRGVSYDTGNKHQRRGGQTHVHGKHKAERQHDHEDNSCQLIELLRAEFLDHRHIAGTALNNVSRRMCLMPRVRKAGDVAVKPVLHIFDKCLSRFAVFCCGQPAKKRTRKRSPRDTCCHGESPVPPVHGDPEQLRDHQVTACHQQRRQRAECEITPASAQKGQKQATFCFLIHRAFLPVF